MPSIKYFAEDIVFKLPHPRKTTTWIKEVIGQEGFSLGEVNFIFCSDKHLHTINVEYLDHDTYTDIITFDNSEEKNLIEGDIFISIDRIRENAILFQNEFDRELHRVIIHGVLHLLGYTDKTKAKKKVMTNKEDECLSLR
ncbi:rRNA maturation RNase YbeY [Pseudochryseolinea flava]|uniref:Endoribonuclease YbeY n=1 Tax=Pseudochryseolinea flava TaxID=2059302 RepID=A0A364Y856_9BACT|nr:rRNA maturation RNase YbeY [Pseudochryseolinea flava]RAW03167.1 rRNA maturation RNase YbeY [Pseudochryseolinea flava]